MSMTLRDEFLQMILWSQKNRDSVYKLCGWKAQFDELDKRYSLLVQEKARLMSDLHTANNKIIELERAVAKLTKPKRKYIRHKPLKKKTDE